MKSVTEFPKSLLNQGIDAKIALAGEGKTPEEIQASLGATFKYEGDKLKYFFNALDVAAQNADGLRRLLIVILNEGESAPAKSVKVEEHYYVPEFYSVVSSNVDPRDARGGRGGKGRPGGRGGGNDRGGGSREMKQSPWGLSPEQKAAKKGAGKGSAAPK